MSVPKSRRKDAAAQYIQDARELRIITMQVVRRMPKAYKWVMTDNLLQLAGQIYTDCIKANAIYVHRGMMAQDYNLRHRYLRMAETATDALLGEITFAYSIVDDGNNYFDGKADYNRVFSRWVEKGNVTRKRIRGVLDSDKRRWDDWRKQAEGKTQ